MVQDRAIFTMVDQIESADAGRTYDNVRGDARR